MTKRDISVLKGILKRTSVDELVAEIYNISVYDDNRILGFRYWDDFCNAVSETNYKNTPLSSLGFAFSDDMSEKDATEIAFNMCENSRALMFNALAFWC